MAKYGQIYREIQNFMTEKGSEVTKYEIRLFLEYLLNCVLMSNNDSHGKFYDFINFIVDFDEQQLERLEVVQLDKNNQ